MDQNLKIKFGYKLSCSLRLQLSLKNFNVAIYFENLTVELHVLYVLKIHIKFYVNQMLFIIWSINLNFYVILDYKNSKFKDLIDDITIDLWFSWKFASMEDIRRKYNSMMNFSQFTSNKKNI